MDKDRTVDVEGDHFHRMSMILERVVIRLAAPHHQCSRSSSRRDDEKRPYHYRIYHILLLNWDTSKQGSSSKENYIPLLEKQSTNAVRPAPKGKQDEGRARGTKGLSFLSAAFLAVRRSR
jgi:hypothetical protein